MMQETPEGVGPRGSQEPPSSSWHGPEPEAAPHADPGPEDTRRIPARTELEELAAEAERLVRDGIEHTERRIRRHPLASVGIAAGAGLLLGLLFGRGR